MHGQRPNSKLVLMEDWFWTNERSRWHLGIWDSGI